MIILLDAEVGCINQQLLFKNLLETHQQNKYFVISFCKGKISHENY
jgi:hypothetical protein